MPRQQTGIGPVALGVIIGGSVLLLAVVVGCAGLLWIGTRPKSADSKDLIPAAGGKEAETRKTFTRDEWRIQTLRKTPEDLIALLGRPDMTTNFVRGKETWHYRQRVLNPATGKYDTGLVDFETGVVVRAYWF